ncbi:MAG: OmpA family protein [Cyclobacteriaceae bacterium]|jgi:outer membrane protein OmpA-like peptidoglycan-associated protein
MKYSPIILLLLQLVCILPTTGQNAEAEVQDILRKLDAGESIENMVINLSDINFETGTARLEGSATTYLNMVVSLMQKAPNIDLYIQGHADNTGSEELNNQLSLERAQSVQDFLFGQGIESNRFSIRGYGSTMPIASNNTIEGRAQNRRVKMVVLKRKEVETIQDIIVLRNSQRIGSVVIDYNDENVIYTQFISEDTLIIQTERVDTIYFADGTMKAFSRPTKEKFNLAEWWNEHVPIFKQSASFHRGNFVVGLGLGVNNIGIGYSNHQVSIPPALFIAELPVGHNVGVGITAGTMRWARQETPDILYMYYAVSTRLAYHFNLGRKLDIYTGVAVNGRKITVTNTEVTLSREKIDLGMILGIRYYLNSTFGFFGEIGDENVAYPKAGLVIKFGN